MRGSYAGELREYGGFEGGDFGDGFDYEVGGGEVGHLGCGVEEGASCVGVGLGEALFGDIFC